MNINNNSRISFNTTVQDNHSIEENQGASGANKTGVLQGADGTSKEVIIVENPPSGFDSTVSSQAENPISTPKEETVFQAKSESNEKIYSTVGRRTNVGELHSIINTMHPSSLTEGAQKENYHLQPHKEEIMTSTSHVANGKGTMKIRQGSVLEGIKQFDTIPEEEEPPLEMDGPRPQSYVAPEHGDAGVEGSAPKIMYDEVGQEIVHNDQENAISLKLKAVESGKTEAIESIYVSALKDNYFLRMDRGEIKEESKEPIYAVPNKGKFSVKVDDPHKQALEKLMLNKPNTQKGKGGIGSGSSAIKDSDVPAEGYDEIDGLKASALGTGRSGIGDLGATGSRDGIGEDTSKVATGADSIEGEHIYDEIEDLYGDSVKADTPPPLPPLPTFMKPSSSQATAVVGAKSDSSSTTQSDSTPSSQTIVSPAMPSQSIVVEGSTNNINVNVPDMATPIAQMLERLLPKIGGGDGGNNPSGGVSASPTTPAKEPASSLPPMPNLDNKKPIEDEKQAGEVGKGVEEKTAKPEEKTSPEEKALLDKFPDKKDDIQAIKKDIIYTNVWQYVVNAGLSVAGESGVNFENLMQHVQKTINEAREEVIKAKATGKAVVSTSITKPTEDEDLTPEVMDFKANLKKMLVKQMMDDPNITPESLEQEKNIDEVRMNRPRMMRAPSPFENSEEPVYDFIDN